MPYMTSHYQRAGRAFELDTLQDAVTGQYLLVWRYPNGRLHAESFPGLDAFRACHHILTHHLEAMGWQCSQNQLVAPTPGDGFLL